MIRESRAIGSLLDLLVTENDIMLKIEGAQTDMAEAIKMGEGLQACETARNEYYREKYNKAEREHERLENELDEVRAKIAGYIRYRYAYADVKGE